MHSVQAVYSAQVACLELEITDRDAIGLYVLEQRIDVHHGHVYGGGLLSDDLIELLDRALNGLHPAGIQYPARILQQRSVDDAELQKQHGHDGCIASDRKPVILTQEQSEVVITKEKPDIGDVRDVGKNHAVIPTGETLYNLV